MQKIHLSLNNIRDLNNNVTNFISILILLFIFRKGSFLKKNFIFIIKINKINCTIDMLNLKNFSNTLNITDNNLSLISINNENDVIVLQRFFNLFLILLFCANLTFLYFIKIIQQESRENSLYYFIISVCVYCIFNQ